MSCFPTIEKPCLPSKVSPPTIGIRCIEHRARRARVLYTRAFKWEGKKKRFHVLETTFVPDLLRVGIRKQPDSRSRLDETEIAWQWRQSQKVENDIDVKREKDNR